MFESNQPHRKRAHGLADLLLIEVENKGRALAFYEAGWAQT